MVGSAGFEPATIALKERLNGLFLALLIDNTEIIFLKITV